jgi:hypothetical protein
MKTAFGALLIAAMVSACEAREREQEEAGEVTKGAADTMVTERQVQDTAIVRTDTTIKTDTNVDVDTMRKSGEAGARDTVKKPR